jgi:hypothetical protein
MKEKMAVGYRELELLCLDRHENNIRMIKFLDQRHVAENPGMLSGRCPGAMLDA